MLDVLRTLHAPLRSPAPVSIAQSHFPEEGVNVQSCPFKSRTHAELFGSQMFQENIHFYTTCSHASVCRVLWPSVTSFSSLLGDLFVLFVSQQVPFHLFDNRSKVLHCSFKLILLFNIFQLTMQYGA